MLPAGMKPEDVGGQYRALVSYVHETLDNLKKRFPSYEEKAGYEVFTFSWLMQRLGWQPKRVNLMLRHVRREFHKEQLAKRRAQEAAAQTPEAQGAKAVQAQFEALAGRQS